MVVLNAAVDTVNMKALAHASVSKWTKARIATEIRKGRTVPIHFSQRQLAELLGVSQGYISYVAKLYRED
jgi:hypothetical protein